MSHNLSFFATCPKGLESLLLQELSSLGAVTVKETVAGVHFEGPMQLGYRVCLWTRLANRVLMPVANHECAGVDDLYEGVKAVPWAEHLSVDGSFAIDFSGSLPGLTNSHFGTLKAKDAVADYFSESQGRRPDVNTEAPDLRINIRVQKGRLTVSIDLSGDSLHKRGYRQRGGLAPLKENLAAVILLRADWPGMAAQGGCLLDPMCGSGTLLIEGALMAANIAPGLLRQRWGFSSWLGHDENLWNNLLEQAQEVKRDALSAQGPEIRGYDASPKAVSVAEANIEQAGLTGRVRIIRKELSKFTKPTHIPIDRGLIITNPPYGERLGDESALLHLYRHLGQHFKEEFVGWRAGVFTGNPDLGKRMGIRSSKQYQLFNGAIPSKLLMFDIQPDYFVHSREPAEAADGANSQRETIADGVPLTAGAQMFANRLKKNRKQLGKWIRQSGVTCYRLYDADMPEYSVAVDCYNDWVHVAEYSPPAKVDPQAAETRLREVLSAIPVALEIPPERVVLKQRRRQKGQQQYSRHSQTEELMEVREGQATLLVNLRDYLDTGLFLDHRKVRLEIAKLAKGQRFLNLFCYTATASVHAALGGATFTDSVDLSGTYLEWGKKNIALNGFSETSHRFIRADVREWLKTAEQRYDLILLDPPTFSNSKKMDGVLDIQRDHLELIEQCMSLLTTQGVLIFSTNQRRFTLDDGVGEAYNVEDKTHWSLDKDFQRSTGIHQCWFITHSR